MSMQEAPRSRPGGRSARVVRDVLNAAIDVFAEHGYAGLSFEAVAARAGVNKTTVYRRWPTRAELMHAALVAMREEEEPVPDTGTLRGDLRALLHARVKRFSSPRGRTVARAVMMSAMEPELVEILAKLRRDHPTVPKVVIERAVARRELPQGVDAQLLGETLVAPIISRVLWKGMEVGPAFITKLVDLVIDGAATHRMRS
jgi:AcrR family transcriptional regulator